MQRSPPHNKEGINSIYYNFICDRCGSRYSSNNQRQEWTGLIVCSWCYEEKHPDLYPPRVRPNDARPAHPRAEFEAGSLGCALTGVNARVGYATVGCAIVGLSAKFK